MQNNNYKGFSLFNDVEDANIRNFNRARILVNIMEDHLDAKTNQVTVKGGSLVFGYFAEVADDDKQKVAEQVQEILRKKGIAVE